MTVFSASRKKTEITERPAVAPPRAALPRPAAPAEAERDLLAGVLDVITRAQTVNAYLECMVRLLQDYARCGSIGIRLLDGEGNIPYACYTGFTREFYRSEDRLSVHRDRCLCVNVVTHDFEPGLPRYTEGGSFVTNGLSKLLDLVPEERVGRCRRVCRRFGYESMALVPIRHGNQVLGLVHLAYEAENQMPLERVQILERVGSYAGQALRAFLTEEALRQSETAHRTRIDCLKDEFLDIASHEMRAPLTVIVGAVNTALAELTRLSPEETRQLLQDAADEAETLTLLLGNFLELSRAQAGRLALDREAVNVRKLVQEAVDKAAQQHPGRRFAVDVAARLSRVSADQPRLERVLGNLLENAAKNSPGDGEIRVFARPEAGSLLIGISDQRPDAAVKDLADLFAPDRAEDARSIRGAGLGLLVCRRLVEAHGGRIWVEPGLGHGCTVLFTLPWTSKVTG